MHGKPGRPHLKMPSDGQGGRVWWHDKRNFGQKVNWAGATESAPSIDSQILILGRGASHCFRVLPCNPTGIRSQQPIWGVSDNLFGLKGGRYIWRISKLDPRLLVTCDAIQRQCWLPCFRPGRMVTSVVTWKRVVYWSPGCLCSCRLMVQRFCRSPAPYSLASLLPRLSSFMRSWLRVLCYFSSAVTAHRLRINAAAWPFEMYRCSEF